MLTKLLVSLVLFLAIMFNFTTTNAAPVQDTVEGEGNHFVTGESYPSELQVSGYNSRDDKLYLNMTLTTTKSVVGQTPTFNYYINVFDNNGALLGNAGDGALPETKVGTLATSTTTVVNKEVSLSSPLTSAYQAIVTVDNVQLN